MKTPEEQAFDAGRDCGRNGANTTNCHFSHFATRELEQEWSRGKAIGEKERPAADVKKA